MNITIVGAGYVGLTTAVCLAAKGNSVFVHDVDKTKMSKIASGEPPFYEPQVKELLLSGLNSASIIPSADLNSAIRYSDAVFVCVGTPANLDGSINLDYIKQAAKSIGTAIRRSTDKTLHRTIVIKSTVVPGTTETIVISALGRVKNTTVCVNPEFLKEGTAINDFLNTSDTGIVVGIDEKGTEEAWRTMQEIYRQFGTITRTSIKGAEMIKYARNAYLAKDISFANELANLCSSIGIDYEEVKKGMMLDKRIGSFISAGIGYGGSCFPKDVRALLEVAKGASSSMTILRSAELVNNIQPYLSIRQLRSIVGEFNNKKIGILGVAFKGNTDDIRESRGIIIAKHLADVGAIVTVYDETPQAIVNAKKVLEGSVNYASSITDCLSSTDIWIIANDGKEFANPMVYFSVTPKILVDGRRIVDPKGLPKNIRYIGVGYPAPA